MWHNIRKITKLTCNAWSGLVSRSWNVSRHKNQGFRSSWQPLICDLQRVLFPLTGTRNLGKTNRPTSANLEVMWPFLKWNSADERNSTWRRTEEHFCAGSFHFVTDKVNLQVSHDQRSYERNSSNCVHNCDDHSLLDFKFAVQYMKYFIYHLTK